MKKSKTTIIITFCSLFILIDNLNAQVSQEFEGVITYSHQVIALDPEYDVERDYSYIGKQSDFFYKTGKYKWLNQNAFMQMDMFRSKDSIEFLKMQSTDTILCAKNNYANEKVTEYEIIKDADTVLGHICNILVIKAISNGNEWTRRYSFTNEYPLNPILFENYKYNSTDIIYSLIKALPLKIEIIYGDRKITYKALKVVSKQLKDNLFDFDTKTKFKSLM